MSYSFTVSASDIMLSINIFIVEARTETIAFRQLLIEIINAYKVKLFNEIKIITTSRRRSSTAFIHDLWDKAVMPMKRSRRSIIWALLSRYSSSNLRHIYQDYQDLDNL